MIIRTFTQEVTSSQTVDEQVAAVIRGLSHSGSIEWVWNEDSLAVGLEFLTSNSQIYGAPQYYGLHSIKWQEFTMPDKYCLMGQNHTKASVPNDIINGLVNAKAMLVTFNAEGAGTVYLPAAVFDLLKSQTRARLHALGYFIGRWNITTSESTYKRYYRFPLIGTSMRAWKDLQPFPTNKTFVLSTQIACASGNNSSTGASHKSIDTLTVTSDHSDGPSLNSVVVTVGYVKVNLALSDYSTMTTKTYETPNNLEISYDYNVSADGLGDDTVSTHVVSNLGCVEESTFKIFDDPDVSMQYLRAGTEERFTDVGATIDAVSNSLQNAVETINTNVGNEVIARQEADDDLAALISSLQERVSALEGRVSGGNMDSIFTR